MTPRLPARSGPDRRKQNSATLLALLFVLAIAVGLLALVSVVLPDVFKLVLVLAGFCLFVCLHYFTWGQWLIKKTTPKPGQQDSEDPIQ